jgi:hypothetical protein
MINLTLAADEAAIIQETLSAAADDRFAELTDAQQDVVWMLMKRLDLLQRAQVEERAISPSSLAREIGQ